MRRNMPGIRMGMLPLSVALSSLYTARSTSEVRSDLLTPIIAPVVSDPRKVSLGERLFRDRRLSFDERKSCLSCHDLAHNGATAARSDSYGAASFAFNTPTIFNASLSFRMNWEGDLPSVDAETQQTLFHRGQLGMTPQLISARLTRDPVIANAFSAAFHRPVDAAGVADAISRYVDTLRTPDAPFDQWLKGDHGALTAQELRGYGRFRALGCAYCHQGVNIGGNMYQTHGIFHPLAPTGPATLRVPSLRNVATTAPYFHDGSAPTLREAVRAMGRAQLDRNLSRPEVDDLVAFLGTLTGRYNGRVVSAPPQ